MLRNDEYNIHTTNGDSSFGSSRSELTAELASKAIKGTVHSEHQIMQQSDFQNDPFLPRLISKMDRI